MKKFIKGRLYVWRSSGNAGRLVVKCTKDFVAENLFNIKDTFSGKVVENNILCSYAVGDIADDWLCHSFNEYERKDLIQMNETLVSRSALRKLLQK